MQPGSFAILQELPGFFDYPIHHFSAISCNFPIRRNKSLKLRNYLITLFILQSSVSSVFSAVKAQDPVSQVDSLIEVLYDRYFYADYDSGVLFLQKAEQFAIGHGLLREQANVIFEKAWIAQNFGKLADMKKAIEEAGTVIGQLEPDSAPMTFANFYYTKASFLARLGDHFGSISEYRKILAMNYNDSSLLHDTYNSLGFNYIRAGNPLQAIEYYQQALNWLPKEAGEDYFIASQSLDLQSIGLSYLDYFNITGDSVLLSYGLKYLSDASKNISGSKPSYLVLMNTYSIRKNLARAYILNNQPDSARYYLDHVREKLRPGNLFNYHLNLEEGRLNMYLEDYKTAIYWYRQALEVAVRRYERTDSNVIDIYTRLAEAYLANNEPDKAYQVLREGFNIIGNVKNTFSKSSYANLALPMETALTKVLAGEFNRNPEMVSADSVLGQFSKTMSLVREMRKAFPGRAFKEFLSSEGKSLSGMAINTCFEAFQQTNDPRYIEKAFLYSEESKALTLLENTMEYEAIDYAGIPDSVIAEGNRLKRELAETEIAIKSGDSVNSDLTGKHRQLEKYIDYLEEKYPAYYELKYNINIPKTDEIIASLKKKTRLLHYFVDAENAFLISLDHSGKTFLKLPDYDSEEVRNLLARLQVNPVSQGSADPYGDYESAGKEVFKMLTGNLPEDDTRQLLIVPDEVLHLIPFEVLIDRKGVTLLEKYQISYNLSATLMQLKKRTGSGHYSGKYVGYAPRYTGRNSVEVRGNENSDTETTRLLGSLKYNDSEVQSLREWLGGEIYLGDEATKSAFLRSADKNEVFHLSAHGLFNDRSPLNSAVYFSQTDTGDYREENILYAYEIYGQNLQTELGILSSCESGFGSYQSGEGLSSLRRAFYFAGCQSIVSSLWSANDKATAGIISLFGENLSEGNSKDEALQQAKLTFLKENDAAYKHPYYWAHLTVSGDTTPLRRPVWPYIIGFSLLLCVSIAIFVSVRKSMR